MQKAARQFLLDMLSTPSPSGFEASVTRIWLDYVSSFADEVLTDSYGNAFAIVYGGAGRKVSGKSARKGGTKVGVTENTDSGETQGDPLVMFEGHSDEIGMMITYVDDDGYLWIDRIGGVDPKMLPGKRVVVQGIDGSHLPGVIGCLAPHMQVGELREKNASFGELYVDIGATSKTAALELVRAGCPLTIDAGPVQLLGQTLAARGCDNRIGIWSSAEGLRRYKELSGPATVVAASHVQEEVGLHGAAMGAFRFNPHACITVDVGNATDFPDAPAKVKGEVKLGRGPIIRIGPAAHPAVNARLEQIASDQKIPLQRMPIPIRSGTNANSIYPTRSGIPTAILSTPNRYMHSSSETIDLNDLDQIPTLMARFAASLKKGERFTVHKGGRG